MPKQYRPHVNRHIGARIQLCRFFREVDLEQLSKVLHISYSRLSHHEAGFCSLKASRLFEIAHTLDVPIAYFVAGLDTSIPSPTTRVKYDTATRNLLEYFISLPENKRHKMLEALKLIADSQPIKKKTSRKTKQP